MTRFSTLSDFLFPCQDVSSHFSIVHGFKGYFPALSFSISSVHGTVTLSFKEKNKRKAPL